MDCVVVVGRILLIAILFLLLTWNSGMLERAQDTFALCAFYFFFLNLSQLLNLKKFGNLFDHFSYL